MRQQTQNSFLRQHREAIYGCVKCGACQTACPTYAVTGDESRVARGRLSLLEAVLDGGLEVTRGLDERITSCVGCMACDAACPSGVPVHEIIMAARAELAAQRHSHRLARRIARGAARGSAGPPRLTRAAAATGVAAYRRLPDSKLAPWWREGGKRSLPPVRRATLADIVGNETPATASTRKVALFPGCATNIAYPETGQAAIGLFIRSGIAVAHPRSLECCGLPFLSLGDVDAARSAAETNLAILSGLDVDNVVTVCSSCALMLKSFMPRLLGEDREDAARLASKVLDIHEMLGAGELRGGALQARGGRMRATWHDPCHMRHGLGISVKPVDFISRIEGIDYIDMEPGCCGGAGAFSFLNYDLSLKIGERRAEEIAATGADVVATGCPGCRMHLTDVLRRSGSGVRVVHTVDLLAGRA